MKKIRNQAASEEEAKASLKEAVILRSLAHPNIVSYVESFVHDGRLCIVQEFADGTKYNNVICFRRRLEI